MPTKVASPNTAPNATPAFAPVLSPFAEPGTWLCLPLPVPVAEEVTSGDPLLDTAVVGRPIRPCLVA